MNAPRIPLGDWVEAVVEWLQINAGWFFDGARGLLLPVVERLEQLLAWPPPLVFAVLVGLLGWRARGVAFAVFSFLAMLLIDAMGMWDAAMDTLALVIVAATMAVLVGVPLGIAAARRPSVSAALRPALDFMQTLPVFVYLIPAVSFFAIGKMPGLVATFVFAMPPGVRFTELGIRGVDEQVVEAAQAFGATPRTVLTRVQVPLALPTIMGGVNQVIMLALSMVVIAGMVGGGGLGAVVFRSVTRLQVGLGFEGGTAVVLLAIVLDRLTSALGDRARPRDAG